jgi:SHS2 domain-containing protein
VTRIAVRGATLAAAFAEAAVATLAAAVRIDAIAEREVREVRAHGSTVSGLLANWINECLYVLEVEDFAWRRVEFAVFETGPGPGAEPMRLHALLHGEQVSADIGPGAVSQVSPASVEIRPMDGSWEIVLHGQPGA